jgi:hypothetical protein
MCALVCVAPLVASVSNAHHSTSMYDRTKEVQLDGTVREQLWVNPHSSVTVTVRNPDGTTTDWSVETGAPNINLRHGWRRDTLKPGDHVRLVIYRHMNGSPSGTLVRITLPDGRVLDGASGYIDKELGSGGVDPGTSAPPAK